MNEYARVPSRDYLATLRRIPDDIFLAIFSHDFDEGDGDRCVCGWAMREGIARVLGVDADATDETNYESYETCQRFFGGDEREWLDLYYDAASRSSEVEMAVVDRLNEIVR